MRHYEIVLLVPQTKAIKLLVWLNAISPQIKEAEGQIHRLEDWGRRQLCPINKIQKHLPFL